MARAAKNSKKKKKAATKRGKKAVAKKAAAKKATRKKKAKKAPAKTTPSRKKATKRVAKKSGAAERPSTGTKKRELRKGPQTEVTEDVLEFIRALDEFKKAHNRPFPTWSEILQVLRNLGYRKG